jgi:importin subunit beta-1
MRNKRWSESPQILTLFGDIAVAIGHQFTNYFSTVMTIIGEASRMTESPAAKQLRAIKERQVKLPPGIRIVLPEEDEDSIDHRNELREGCLQAYIGIMKGFKNSTIEEAGVGATTLTSSNLRLLIPYLGHICKFLSTIADDKRRSRNSISTAVKVIGDLCSNYGNQILDLLYTDEILSLLMSGKRSRVIRTKGLATQ